MREQLRKMSEIMKEMSELRLLAEDADDRGGEKQRQSGLLPQP